jgi:hypothetical protein
MTGIIELIDVADIDLEGFFEEDLDEDIEELDYAEPQYSHVHYSRSSSGGVQPWTCF